MKDRDIEPDNSQRRKSLSDIEIHKKKKKKYATAAEISGMNYRSISEIMTERGDRMNHATARNICMESLERLVLDVAIKHDVMLSPERLMEIARDPAMQESFSDIISEILQAKQL